MKNIRLLNHEAAKTRRIR